MVKVELLLCTRTFYTLVQAILIPQCMFCYVCEEALYNCKYCYQFRQGGTFFFSIFCFDFFFLNLFFSFRVQTSKNLPLSVTISSPIEMKLKVSTPIDLLSKGLNAHLVGIASDSPENFSH